jgi:hypothetical protein
VLARFAADAARSRVRHPVRHGGAGPTRPGGTIGSLLANPIMGLLSELIAVRSAFLILDCVLACAFAYMTARYVHW